MKILKKGHAYKQRCNKCNSLLLIDAADIETGTYTDYGGFKETYKIFCCAVCGSCNDIDDNLSYRKGLVRGNFHD